MNEEEKVAVVLFAVSVPAAVSCCLITRTSVLPYLYLKIFTTSCFRGFAVPVSMTSATHSIHVRVVR